MTARALDHKGFVYEQSTGDLWLVNGPYELPLGTGFAGNQDGRNNPAMERVRNIGPLPAGYYRMWEDRHPRFAAPAFRLGPETETEMFGRTGFWIHGGRKSEGCPVFDWQIRVVISALMRTGYERLRVIP